MAWLFLIFSTIFNSTASMLIKIASINGSSSDNFLDTYLSWQFILACFLFASNLFFYAQAIKSIPLYVAYPFVTGITIISLTLFSLFYSNEHISLIDYIAIAMILIAISMLSR